MIIKKIHFRMSFFGGGTDIYSIETEPSGTGGAIAKRLTLC